MHTVHWARYYPLALYSHMCDVQIKTNHSFVLSSFIVPICLVFPFILWRSFFRLISLISFLNLTGKSGRHKVILVFKTNVAKTGAYLYQFSIQGWFAKLHPFFTISMFSISVKTKNSFIFPFLFSSAFVFSFYFRNFYNLLLLPFFDFWFMDKMLKYLKTSWSRCHQIQNLRPFVSSNELFHKMFRNTFDYYYYYCYSLFVKHFVITV